MRIPTILLLSALPLLSALACSGCSGPAQPKCYPVKGVVQYEGQAVAEALVVFHPLGDTPTNGPKPVAYTDAEGRFVLTTNKSGDGAPAGQYAITVELRDQKQVGEELVREGPNLLPPRYADAQNSGLNYQVRPEPNEVPTLMLTK